MCICIYIYTYKVAFHYGGKLSQLLFCVHLLTVKERCFMILFLPGRRIQHKAEVLMDLESAIAPRSLGACSCASAMDCMCTTH